MIRTQIYLDRDQAERLDRRADQVGKTRSALIREAIDRYLDDGRGVDAALMRFKAAVQASAGALRRMPSGREYVEALRRADVRRQAELERRRG